jgi:hypothetical protein
VKHRLPAALAIVALALPAAAYLLPGSAVLKKAAEKKASLELQSIEAAGTVELRGAAAGLGGGPATLSARFLVRTPGRVRFELQPTDATEAERPFLAARDEKLTSRGGLDQAPAAVALVRALGALLAPAADAEGKGLAEALARRGVKVEEVSLGRFNGRLAWVLGGRLHEQKPAALALFDKETWMPLRFVTAEATAPLDVRLLDWNSAVGADRFPRAIEVWQGGELLLRFTTEKAVANPKLADALF